MGVVSWLRRWQSVASLAFACCAFGGSLLLVGCGGVPTQNVEPTPAVYAAERIPEDLLLDVEIEVFDPSPENSDEELLDAGTHPDIRRAEARYIPVHLKHTLQRTGQWGAVRVTPARSKGAEVNLNGTIIDSNGEELVLEIEASDATGASWFHKRYKSTIKQVAYSGVQKGYLDPYQDLYNAIANDLVAYREQLQPSELRRIRTVAKLRFAADLAPEAFSGYLNNVEDGGYEIDRLPAEQDPMMLRVLRVRERDYMFADTLSEHYAQYYDDLWEPYLSWRRSYLEEANAKRDIQGKARTRTLLGIAAILGAIGYELAAGRNTSSTATNVMVLGGAMAVKSGIDIGKEAQIHADAIQELSQSFGADAAPIVMDVEGRVVTLRGSAEEQYREWRRLLRAIFANETGLPVSGDVPPTADEMQERP
jgi:hypothetical protein